MRTVVCRCCNNVAICESRCECGGEREGEGEREVLAVLTPRGMSSSLSSSSHSSSSKCLFTNSRAGKDCAVTESEILFSPLDSSSRFCVKHH